MNLYPVKKFSVRLSFTVVKFLYLNMLKGLFSKPNCLINLVLVFAKDWVFLYANFVNSRFSYTRDFHAQFPVFATPRPTKLLVAREKKPLPKDAEVFCRRAAVLTAVLTTILCARWAPNSAVSQMLEDCNFLLMSFRLVSIYFLSSLLTQV